MKRGRGHRRTGIFLQAVAGVALAGALSGCEALSMFRPDVQVPANPSGDCVAPGNGSRAGYHSTTDPWLLDCNNPLKREYWRVFTNPDKTAYIIPRPDGDPHWTIACRDPDMPIAKIASKYSLCDPAVEHGAVDQLNAMEPGLALEIAHYLHLHLVFAAPAGAAGFTPFPIPSDTLDACEVHPNENSADFAELCQRERDNSMGLFGLTYEGPGAVELAARLNELYGIDPDAIPPGS